MRKIFRNKKFLVLFICFLVVFGALGIRHIIYTQVYNSAYEYVLNGNPSTAVDNFLKLPRNFSPNDEKISVDQWIKSIDKYYDSPFIGVWKNDPSWGKGEYTIEISMVVSSYANGVYLKYDKSYDAENGVHLWDYGKVEVDDEETAHYYASKESNAENYTLILNDDNTLEVYFDGLRGNQREVTLHRCNEE